MRFKVELIYTDRDNEKNSISYFSFVEASDKFTAISIAKKNQPIDRPDLSRTDYLAWSVYETAEQI